MKTHELYINDIRMDIDKDVNIYLTYQSPIFTDLKTTVSNHTNNISLPLTPNNARAIEMYHLVDKQDSSYTKKTFPRRWHTVRYYRNGIEICNSGRGVLNNIGEGRINFAFVWGNIENFKELSDKTLNQLLFTDALAWYNGTEYLKSTDLNANYGFYNFDFGGGINKKQYQHPCVKTNFIISQIAKDNKININYIKNNKILTKDYIIPCLTKKASGSANENIAYSSSNNIIQYFDEPDPNMSTQFDLRYHGYLSPNGDSYIDPFSIWDSDQKLFDVEVMDKIRIIISGFTIKEIYGMRGCKLPSVYFRLNDEIIESPSERISNSEFSYYRFNGIDKEIDVSSMKTMKILLVKADYNYSDIYFTEVPTIKIIPYIKEAIYGAAVGGIKYPLALNLPEITHLDFLQAMMHINGLFAVVKTKHTIDFISVDDIINNIPHALDWTGKLVNNNICYNQSKDIDFRLSGFAQRNLCQYDNDSEIGRNYDGVIYLNDETVETSKVAIELPFSQSENTGKGMAQYAVIPIYEKDSSSDDYILKNGCKPRILSPKLINGVFSASFENLDWDYILRTRYKSYQKIIRNPRIIKAQCKLDELDLLRLDFSVPVTFAQYGNYYVILKIQSAANGVCNCEFLEIKTDKREAPGMPGEL